MLIEVPIAFRLARSDDLPATEWMGLFTRHRKIILDTFAEQERGAAAMVLALANGFPVGQVWVDFAREFPRFWALRVFPPLQGAGIGSRLLAEAERMAAGTGARAAEVGVEPDNPRASKLYRRLGYRPVGEETEQVGYEFEGAALEMTVEQVIMRKNLAGS